MMTKKTEKKSPSFEKALARLEEIVEKLDSGNLPLSDSLALFKEGTQLANLCRSLLAQAEREVKEALAEVDAAAPQTANAEAVAVIGVDEPIEEEEELPVEAQSGADDEGPF